MEVNNEIIEFLNKNISIPEIDSCEIKNLSNNEKFTIYNDIYLKLYNYRLQIDELRETCFSNIQILYKDFKK